MKAVLFSTLIVISIAVAACSNAAIPTPTPTPSDVGGPRRVTLDTPFVLKVGEFVEIVLPEGTATLHFVEVRNDSRCPRGVQCVWAGEANVRLTGLSSTGASTTLDIVVGASGEGTGQFDSIRVVVSDLLPYPESAAPIPHDAYSVTVVVSQG